MREDSLEGVVLLPKSIRNSQVVREVDPRSSRELWGLLLLVGVLVAGLGLYAWPHLALRQSGQASEQMYRERERLIEENRKLRLERASLENLRRVESIALRDLGLVTPAAERIVVVERPQAVPDAARLARDGAGEAARN
jgi:cell division protein FtsL